MLPLDQQYNKIGQSGGEFPEHGEEIAPKLPAGGIQTSLPENQDKDGPEFVKVGEAERSGKGGGAHAFQKMKNPSHSETSGTGLICSQSESVQISARKSGPDPTDAPC